MTSTHDTKLLRERYPAATSAECERFLAAFAGGKESAEKLSSYLEWRRENKEFFSDQAVDDAKDWEDAAAAAFFSADKISEREAEGREAKEKLAEKEGKTPARKLQKRKTQVLHYGEENFIPQLVFENTVSNRCIDVVRDKSGHRILQVLPAQIDLEAASPDTYATAFALYLDRKFDRESSEQVTVMIDVRPGDGWCNPSAIQLLGVIRQVAASLHGLHPGRLHQCYLYPIPRPAILVWKMIQGFMDPALVRSMTLISGSASRLSPVPKSRLMDYVDERVLDIMEDTRKQTLR